MQRLYLNYDLALTQINFKRIREYLYIFIVYDCDWSN